jgi:hypothetical protein
MCELPEEIDDVPDLPAVEATRAMRAVWAHLATRPQDAALVAQVLRRATAAGFTRWEQAADLLDAGQGWEAVLALIAQQEGRGTVP